VRNRVVNYRFRPSLLVDLGRRLISLNKCSRRRPSMPITRPFMCLIAKKVTSSATSVLHVSHKKTFIKRKESLNHDLYRVFQKSGPMFEGSYIRYAWGSINDIGARAIL
jgi:hypothetical protein